jgi:hypothetical protein
MAAEALLSISLNFRSRAIQSHWSQAFATPREARLTS